MNHPTDATSENENPIQSNNSDLRHGGDVEDSRGDADPPQSKNDNKEKMIEEYQNMSKETQARVPLGQEEHLMMSSLDKNSRQISYPFIACAFVVVAIASGTTGALIAKQKSPDAISASQDPNLSQRITTPPTVGPTNMVPETTDLLQEPSEEPSPEPTPPPTSPSTLKPTLSIRQAAIVDAFADFGPVLEAPFDWMLRTDKWTPPGPLSGTDQFWRQRYAIAALLYSTEVPHQANSAFNVEYSVCQWSGIECSDGLHVDELDLCKSVLCLPIVTTIPVLSYDCFLLIRTDQLMGL